jgi:drug/metabolite transporter superfamily protein YnfA
VLCFRSGNAHLFVALLTVVALVSWSEGREWQTSAAVALGGAIKIFPLFLVPVFVARREWGLLWKTLVLTVILWALPTLYFGPRQTVALYGDWRQAIAGDFEAYKRQRAVDLSLPGVLTRWLAPVDYSTYVDSGYPQVNVVSLPPQPIKGITFAAMGVLGALSMWMCATLRRSSVSSARDIAAVGAIFITANLLLGPYTPIQHLSAFLIATMTLPIAFESAAASYGLVALGVVNSLLFAIPGSANQRALQAYGVFTLMALTLWAAAMLAASRAAPQRGGKSMKL